jgi:hypothetical protein
MLDLTVPMVEVWFAGAKLGEYANDLEALKAASLHADSLPLIAESVEYELRRDTMKYIVHRRITGPDAPALGPVLTISSTALTVTLDRPASGPTQIDRYELERYNGAAWVQIASGLSIFGASNQYADSSLTASTAYQYRCRAVDTTERASEYSYSSGTTSAGASNSAPVWASVPTIDIQAGSSVDISGYCSDPEGDQITFSKVSSTNPPTMTMSAAGVMTIGSATPVGAQSMVVKADDGALSANKTINLNVTEVSTGAEFFIESGVPTYDAAVAGVQPGDIITIRRGTGTRGPLKIQNLNPTGAPVTIRTDPNGQVIMRASVTSSGGYIFQLTNCHNFEFDGSTSGVTYGLKVMYSSATNPGRPTAFVQFSGSTDDFEMHHVHVDGGFPAQASGSPAIGMQYNDHSINLGSGLFNDGIEIHHCLIENIATEGMYLGPNWVDGDRPLKNVQIHHNTLKNVGWDGIQGKAWWEGTNAIYNNTLTDCGNRLSETQAQLCGISVLSGPVSIYNNKVFGAGQQGIQAFTSSGPPDGYNSNGYGPYDEFIAYIYNNVVVDSGQQGGSIAGTGITVGQTAGTVPVSGRVYSNTVVNCNDTSITNNGNGAGDFTKNNICVGNDANTPTGATQTGNTVTGTPSSLFVAPELNNYHLLAETAAVTGSIGTDYSTTDLEGTSRAGTASRGAYEYS